MNKEEKEALRRQFSKLRKSLEPSTVAANLFSKGILTEEQYHDRISSLPNDAAKNEFILKCVGRHGKRGIFDVLVQSIENADPAIQYLAEELKEELQNVCTTKAEETYVQPPHQPDQENVMGMEETDTPKFDVNSKVSEFEGEELETKQKMEMKLEKILNRSPTDAGLLGVITSENIGKYWTELALALGIPNAMIEDSGAIEQVRTLTYWRNGNVDNADTTWDFLLKKVECLPTLGPFVAEELKTKISMEPLWTME